jgi:hypothetical protein
MTDFLAPAASDGIEESVRRHDRMQFETKMEFRYGPGLTAREGEGNVGTGTRPTTGASLSPNFLGPDLSQNPNAPNASAAQPPDAKPAPWWRQLVARFRRPAATLYDVEMYFFLPYSLGLNSLTYPKNMFYGDLQSYVRVKRPDLSLAQLLGGADSPMGRLEAAAAGLRRAPGNDSARRFEQEMRMFCSVAAKSLFNHVRYALDRRGATGAGDATALPQAFCEGARAVVERYRALRSQLLDPAIGEDPVIVFQFGDEYLSLQAESAAYSLLEELRHAGAADSAVRKTVADLARAEALYRRARGYGCVTERGSDNETTLFRAGVLKKYIAGILFLHTRLGREQQVLEQMLLSAAAGGAMLFATAVAFFFQLRYGALTVPFFLAVVVSYMFKDRLKDMLRYYLTAEAGNWLFDHQTNIFCDSGEKVGTCRESVDFMNEGRVPDAITSVRRKERLTEIENRLTGEKVIRYRKRIGILTDRFSHAFAHAQVDGLTDITRFSVQHVVRKMDDPRRMVYVANDDGTCGRVLGRRVYHVNLVIRYGMRGREAVYRRYRIVLTRKGIRRIEEIAC